MLESFRKGQRWLTLIFVSVIGLVFVFFLGVGGQMGPAVPAGSAVVQLDEIRLTSVDLARERERVEQNLRAQLGDAYEQIGGDRLIDSQALSGLLNGVVLSTAAKELGLRVTKDELRRFVQDSPLFRDEEGRFNPEAFDRFATYNYGSQRSFIEFFTRELLREKLLQLLVGQTGISDAEVDLRTRFELEEVAIAYVSLDAASLPEGLSLSDEEVTAFADEHDDEIRALYEERKASLELPERVRAAHILIRLTPDASSEAEASARDRAEAARQRILDGETFAEVAAELSEDRASAEKGGDLGIFLSGENDPALDAAAFALEAGELSEVIRSGNGYHVIEVAERFAAEVPAYEAVRDEIAREAAEVDLAATRSNEMSEALASAVTAGQSLEDAARAEGLTLSRPPMLKRRRDGFITGLGGSPDLMTAAFSLAKGESSAEVFEIDGKRVLFQVIDRFSPGESQVVGERASRRPNLEVEKQNQVVQSWLDDYRERLERDGRLLINSDLALGS